MASLHGDAVGSNNDEPGCYRFDVLQDNDDPNTIHLYEIYHDEAAVEAHRAAPHYLKWREEVADWFAAETVRRLATRSTHRKGSGGSGLPLRTRQV